MIDIEGKPHDTYVVLNQMGDLLTGEGANLVKSIETSVEGLKTQWVGEDAKIHINGLIAFHDDLVKFLKGAAEITRIVSENIVELQDRIRINGGDEPFDQVIDLTIPAQDLTPISTVERYYVGGNAEVEAAALDAIVSAYDSFVKDVGDTKTALFTKWHAGAGKEGAEGAYSAFLSKTEEYTRYINNARTNLKQAIANLSAVGK